MAKLLIIDTETSGLDPDINSILSLAGVVWENGSIRDEIEIYVREPDIAVDPESMAINRIDLSQLHREGVTPADAVARLRSLLSRHFDACAPRRITLAGHNVCFDVGFLKRLYRLAGVQYHDDFSHRLLDTSSVVGLLMIAGRIPLDMASSSKAFQYFGIDVSQEARHSALGDARATAQLLNCLIGAVNKND